MKISGIYAISTPAGKLYVGSSLDVIRRWKTHIRELRNGCHANLYLQRTFIKYGEHSLTFAVLEQCDKSELYTKEQEYIDALAVELRLNVALQAAGGCGPHSAQTREKIAIAHKGRTHSAEARANMSAAHKGQRPTAEANAKRSESLRGKRHTEAAKRKMSEAIKARYEDEEFRRAHAARCTGRVMSADARAKMSAARTGTKQPKSSLALTGKKRADNGSPYAGVALVGKKWVAQVKYNGKSKHVGSFDTPELAHAARLAFLADVQNRSTA
jgi:group I intron endonuclease